MRGVVAGFRRGQKASREAVRADLQNERIVRRGHEALRNECTERENGEEQAGHPLSRPSIAGRASHRLQLYLPAGWFRNTPGSRRLRVRVVMIAAAGRSGRAARPAQARGAQERRPGSASADAQGRRLAQQCGTRFVHRHLELRNRRRLLARHVRRGDLVLNLSVYVVRKRALQLARALVGDASAASTINRGSAMRRPSV